LGYLRVLRFDLSRDVIGHVTIKPLSLTVSVSEIFNGECDAMVDMAMNDL